MDKEEIEQMLSNFDCGPLSQEEVVDKILIHTERTSKRFLKWIIGNKLAPNSSGLFFNVTLPRETVVFYELDELYALFDKKIVNLESLRP